MISQKNSNRGGTILLWQAQTMTSSLQIVKKTITLANLKKLSDELIADTEKRADKISPAISKKFVAAITEKISVLQQET